MSDLLEADDLTDALKKCPEWEYEKKGDSEKEKEYTALLKTAAKYADPGIYGKL